VRLIGALLGLGLLLPLGLGCAQTVKGEAFPALKERSGGVNRVAVIPFRVTGALAQTSPEKGGTPPSIAAQLVARHLGEAIAARGIEVIPAEDVQRALGIEDPSVRRLSPQVAASVAHESFGADAVLMGQVHRYRDREGEAIGATSPAAVGFQVTLLGAPRGERLWRGTFDEAQAPLTDNLFNAGRYPGGGSRWLSAEELTRWGAEEVAVELPTGR
jgi:hypothetical protein